MITKDKLKDYVENSRKYVQKKDLGNGLFLLKYKRKVFYKSLWNEYLEECRGTIVDEDYNIVSMPFKKIYNFDVEDQAPNIEDNEIVTAFRKVNGFMAAITVYKGDLLVSTTGSIDSIFADRIKEYITDQLRFCILTNPGYTYLFECVHPEDPHIIPEKEGLYYLGKRKNEYNSVLEYPKPLENQLLGCINVVGEVMDMAKVKRLTKSCRHEGYVVYTLDGRSTKLKSPYYLVKKLMARRSNFDNLLSTKGKETVDEEYYPMIDHIHKNIEVFSSLSEQGRLNYMREYLNG